MKLLAVLALTLFASTSITYAANPACEGPIRLDSEECGITILINEKVIGRCLDKVTPAFKTLLSQCVKSREENLSANADNPNAAKVFGSQCGGDMVIENVSCGTHFFILRKDNGGAYQMMCRDLNDSNDELVKDIRSYCEKTLK